MNETFGRSLNRASQGYIASLETNPNANNETLVRSNESAALVAQASGKMQVNPARLAMITGQAPPAGVHPDRLAMMTGAQPEAPQEQHEPTPSEPPVPVPAKVEVPSVVLSEADSKVVTRMENKEWKTHRSWSADLLADGPIKLVEEIVREAGVRGLSIVQLKGAMQARTKSTKAYNTLSLKQYLQHFEVFVLDSEDCVRHKSMEAAAQDEQRRLEEQRARLYCPGVEVAAVQQWKKEGTGIWARKEFSRLKLRLYLILRDMEMRNLSDLGPTISAMSHEMIQDLIEQIDTDECLLGAVPEEITYSQWQLAEDTNAATFLRNALANQLDKHKSSDRGRSRSPRRDRSPHRRRRSHSPRRRRDR